MQPGRPWRRVVLILAATLATGGCVNSLPWTEPGWAIGRPEPERVEALTNALAALTPPSPEARAEAAMIARITLERTRELRERYRPLRLAYLNNLLINAGLRERGLCYQWCNDLLEPLEALPLQHFSLHWGSAFWSSRLTEHNVPVVTARGAPFETGVLLDAWRRGGWLIWMRVKDDASCPFTELSAEVLDKYRPGARQPAAAASFLGNGAP